MKILILRAWLIPKLKNPFEKRSFAGSADRIQPAASVSDLSGMVACGERTFLDLADLSIVLGTKRAPLAIP
jgi:hypothetical protein